MATAPTINVELALISFVEDNIHYIYSPALDLYGYDDNDEGAKESFRIALHDFLSYTTAKKTLHKELLKLGWELKGTKNRTKYVVPQLGALLEKNKSFKKIVNNNNFTKFQEPIALPA